jgi:O-antigen/teichoic acid export membrane protein
MEDRIAKKRIHATIAKGALVNTLGMVGKVVSPLLFIVITRLYGPDTMGQFYLAFTIIGMVISLSVSGLRSGVLMFTSRSEEAKEAGEETLYRILANGFVLALLMSGLFITLAHFGGPGLIEKRYPQPGLMASLKLMVWAVPLNVIPPLVIAATRALIIMKWDAIIDGFLMPFTLLVYAVALYFFTPSLEGLLIAYLLSGATVTAVSLVVFGHYFSFFKLLKAAVHFRLSKPLIRFSVPETLNMTFNRFITNLDVVMLGYFAFKPEVIGFYAMGAQIVRNLRQVKLAFSGIYAPIIARLYERKDYDGINHSFSMVSRWTAMLGFPLALIVALFKDELLLLFHSSFTHDSTFMLVLLIPPLLSCAVGLGGNILVMTGHSFWNLTNSLTVAGLNALLNYFLIPAYGLVGAALATALASAMVSSMYLTEIYFLVKAHLILKRIYKPYLAALPGLVAVLTVYLTVGVCSLAWKGVLAAVVVFTSAGALFLLGFEEEDKKTFFPKRAKS